MSNTTSDMDQDDKYTTLWVGNLAPEVTDEIVYELFINAGPIISLIRPVDKTTKCVKSYAFIRYEHSVTLPYAYKIFNGVSFYKRRLKLQNKATGLGINHNEGRDRERTDLRRQRPFEVEPEPPGCSDHRRKVREGGRGSTNISTDNSYSDDYNRDSMRDRDWRKQYGNRNEEHRYGDRHNKRYERGENREAMYEKNNFNIREMRDRSPHGQRRSCQSYHRHQPHVDPFISPYPPTHFSTPVHLGQNQFLPVFNPSYNHSIQCGNGSNDGLIMNPYVSADNHIDGMDRHRSSHHSTDFQGRQDSYPQCHNSYGENGRSMPSRHHNSASRDEGFWNPPHMDEMDRHSRHNRSEYYRDEDRNNPMPDFQHGYNYDSRIRSRQHRSFDDEGQSRAMDHMDRHSHHNRSEQHHRKHRHNRPY